MKTGKILFFIFLFIGLISSKFSSGQCLSGWKYYMPVIVVNNVSSTLSSYQVKVTVNTASLISAGKMNSSGDDIRFVDSGSCALVPYWIESGINTSTTIIWVKMPKLSGNAYRTIRMFYGNSSASAASNGDNTFVIFDDFNGSSLNTSKWGVYGSNGSYSVSGGLLNLTTASTGRYYSETIVSNSSFSGPLIVEDYLSSLSGYWHSIAIFNSGGYYGYAGSYGYSISSVVMGNTIPYYGSFAAYKNVSNSSPSSTTGIWQLSWPSTGSQSLVWPGGSLTDNSTAVTLGSSIQVGAGMITESNGSLSIDWIRARAYTAKEATTIIKSEITNNYIIVSAISGSPFCTSGSFNLNVPYTFSGSITLS